MTTAADRPSAARRGDLRWLVLAGVVIAAGLGLRAWIHRSVLGVPDSDEAVVALMALHALDGELTAFFWGQGFNGSQEALLTAPLLWVTGPTWVAVRAVPVALSLVTAVLVWRVGRRTIGETAGRAAGLLFLLWPPFVLYKTTHQQGFYASGPLYAALLLLLALRLVERPERGRVAALGLVVGLALWQSTQLVPLVVATLAWCVWRDRSWLRHTWIGVGAAVVGALPAILWNLEHEWGSFASEIESTTSYAHRLRIFVSPLLPMLLGLRVPFSQEPLAGPGALVLLVVALLVALVVIGAVRAGRRDASLLYWAAIAFPFVYALAPATLLSGEPRYLIVLAPVVVLLVAQLATSYARAVGLLAVGAVVTMVVLQGMESNVRSTEARPPVAPRDLGPLVATLDRLGLDRVYADFWLAYRLTFETDERIVAAQSKLAALSPQPDGRVLLTRHPSIRYRPYERRVEADERPGIVLFRSSLEDGADRPPGAEADARAAQLGALVASLRRRGFERVDVGPFVVLAPPRSGRTAAGP